MATPFSKEQLAYLAEHFAPSGHTHLSGQIIVDQTDGETLEQMIDSMEDGDEDEDEDETED